MDAYARAPYPLIKDDDMVSNWQSWKEDFIIFMKITGYIDESNEIRANILKNRIGKIGLEAIQNIYFENIQDKDDMDVLIEKLEEYFNPPKKEVVERYHFFTRTKKQNESIEQYINTLKEKAKTCNFNNLVDSIIRDKIILDTHDKILRKKFFEADNLDLPKLIKIYNDYHINTEKMKQVTKENRIKSTSFTPKPDNNVKKCCWRCSQQHPLGRCPAWGSKCTKCGDVNHFTQCCKGPKSKMNYDKKNKNLLDSMQQAQFIPKNNKWNNQANSIVETTDSMKTIFPDIPTTKLCYNNTTNHAANSPKNTQYSYSYINAGVKSDGISDIRRENIQSESKPNQMKTPCASTSQTRFISQSQGEHINLNLEEHIVRTHVSHSTPSIYKKKKLKNACILS